MGTDKHSLSANATSTAQITDYPELFQSSTPLENRIAQAAARLAMVLNKPMTTPMILAWAQRLKGFSPSQLTEAFIAAEATLDSWPAPSAIVNGIFEAEYAADLTWLLLGLKRHKKTWKDREPIYGPDVRMRNDAESHFDFVRGEMLEAAIPAPPIPPRLMHALQVMGAGTVADGLAELSRHPMTGAFSWDAAEAGKVKFQTERDFKAAWTIARRRELAGGTQ